MTPQVGEMAPAFTLPDASGQSVSLADFAGQRVVVYFYPKDDTPGCTKEACSFRDTWSAFENHHIKVLGISKDPASSHTKVHRQVPTALHLAHGRGTMPRGPGLRKLWPQDVHGP